MNSSKSGHIYLIKAKGTRPARFKIGMTQQGRMSKRFEELNSSQSAFPLELVKVIDVEDRYQVEADLHRQFKGNRKHGEWFEFRNISEVERAMDRVGSSSLGWEAWRWFSLILGLTLLLFAYENHTAQHPSPQIQESQNEQ